MRRPAFATILPLLPLGLAVFVGAATAQDVSIPGRFYAGSAEPGEERSHGTGQSVRLRSVAAAAGLAKRAPELALSVLGSAEQPTPATAAVSRQPAQRVGRVRELAGDAMGAGEWATLPDGREVWRLAVRSPEAAELRIHFTDFAVGAGRVWIYSGNENEPAQEYTGAGLYGDGDFWTATVAAERVVIEYLPASGLREARVPFGIAALGHLWEAASAPGAGPEPLTALSPAPKAAPGLPSTLSAASQPQVAGCHLDVACFPEYRNPASAVARIIYEQGGGLWLCSASLVNTKSGNNDPLLLTASHCIDNELSARSIQANFFFQSGSCGGPLADMETVLGGNYLVSESFTGGDMSLVRLLGLPKSPVYFLGITTEEPKIGEETTGIHHPAGSYKRISFGPRVEDQTIAVSSGGGGLVVSPSDRYYQIDTQRGRIEGGSSGSPLLNGKNQVIGTLSSGPVLSPNPAEQEVLLCQTTDLEYQYGRVSKMWPGLEPFINDLRPGRLAVPKAGDKLAGRSVRFQWSPGTGVSEFRLLVGKTAGSSEYADLKLNKSAVDATVDGLPENGAQIFARLRSLVDGKWEDFDYQFLASSGPAPRPARLLAPAVNAQFEASRVQFQWDAGSNVSEYLLHVGSTPGGIEYAKRAAGRATSALVENLPGNGQTVYARLYSRIGGEWTYTETVHRAADSRTRTYLLRVANRLAYPVSVYVNERSVLSVRAGQTVEQAIPRGAGSGETLVEWKLVRPTHPVTGVPMGEALGSTLAKLVPAEELSFEITNEVAGQLYFTPVVSNSTAFSYYVEANTGLAARGQAGEVASRTGNLGLGYYKLLPLSTVRGYYGSYGYAGAYQATANLDMATEPGSGAVRIEFSARSPEAGLPGAPERCGGAPFSQNRVLARAASRLPRHLHRAVERSVGGPSANLPAEAYPHPPHSC
ncbi:MAG: hypothetical protein IT162_06805 [Bryobacterales bacterium]|nr:hypothetical protein [Bryobacterales bacterium]